MSDVEGFGLFVSSVEGQPVHRFGSPTILIGADRNPDEPRKIIYRTQEVVGIPRAEAQRYAREYARAIADGALTERTAEEYRRQQQSSTTEGGAPRETQELTAPAEQRAQSGPSESGSQLG
jgi:hypothetical protein